MSLQVEKLEHNMAKLTIEVPAEELEKAIESAYLRSRNKISVPGFRKGKAPRKMLEKMYGRELFYEDAANILVTDAYDRELEAYEGEVVSSPEIHVVQIESGKPFIFTAEVALKPEVTLGKYKGVKVERPDTAVTDEEVAAEIDREREKSARTVDVSDRGVQKGDVVTLDFEGFVDGAAFEGGKGKDYPLTIGSGAFIPGFEEALIGAQTGKQTQVNVTFPENYQAVELAGKAAVFECTVTRIQEKQLPELDDEFVEEVSDESDTVEEYREEVRKKLSARKEAGWKQAKEDAVIEAVIADAKMDIPAAMVETQQRQIARDYGERLKSQGLSMEQYMKLTGMTVENLLEQVKPQAMSRIQSRLVLEAVAAAEKIEISEEEMEEQVRSMSEVYGVDIDEARKYIGGKGAQQLKEDLRVRKALDFLVENAKEEKPAKKAGVKKAAAKKSAKKEKEETEGEA